MSRPLKFRAWNWNPEQKEIHHTLDIKHFDELHEVFEISHSYGIAIMQYTGLKDRNGVEVYEGDIIKDVHSDEYGNDTIRIDEVKFNSDPAGFTLGDRWSPLNTTDIKRMSIIGNIYENPELMETKAPSN